MDIPKLLEIYFERSNSVQTCWNLHIAVSLGILAFIAGAPNAASSTAVKVALTIAFALFAASNLSKLTEVQYQRHVIAKKINANYKTFSSWNLFYKINKLDTEVEVKSLATPPEIYPVIGFHLYTGLVIDFWDLDYPKTVWNMTFKHEPLR